MSLQYLGCQGDPELLTMLQLLMLQQQIYQEEQMPIASGNSTQFYSHYTQYQQSLYTDYQSQWQPQDYQQNGYVGNCMQFSAFPAH